MKDLIVTIIQPDLIWENREKNLEHFDELLEPVLGTDLIVLPEMFTTCLLYTSDAADERSSVDLGGRRIIKKKIRKKKKERKKNSTKTRSIKKMQKTTTRQQQPQETKRLQSK